VFIRTIPACVGQVCYQCPNGVVHAPFIPCIELRCPERWPEHEVVEGSEAALH